MKSPIPYILVPTEDSNSFVHMPQGITGLPVGDHVGAFGVQRTHHIHEGVDLYVPSACPVTAMEDGIVLSVSPFTGDHAGSPWWHDTYCVCVFGSSGTILYGEIAPHVKAGAHVKAGELLGVVVPVLKKNKGRPMSMLHIELRDNKNTTSIEWCVGTQKPNDLIDPTNILKVLL